jgi:hypothetical protein
MGNAVRGAVIRNGDNNGATVKTMPTTKALRTNDDSEAATELDMKPVG